MPDGTCSRARTTSWRFLHSRSSALRDSFTEALTAVANSHSERKWRILACGLIQKNVKLNGLYKRV